MSLSRIPVDLLNPGQVFACLGLMEAADTLVEQATAAFDWGDPAAARFLLHVPGPTNPTQRVMEFLAEAQVHSVAPSGSVNRTEKWQVPTRLLSVGSPFPFPDPTSPATLPAVLEASDSRLVLEHWGEGDATDRDPVKFWGGAAGFPGAALARDALEKVRDRCVAASSDPFQLSASQSSSFRFDWRRDYIPIDAGFSLNNHSDLEPLGYPLVELLAALGLSQARPRRESALEYHYEVLGPVEPVVAASASDVLYPPFLMRAALGGTDLPFPRRRFRMQLGWPAKEGQARSITIVTEEAIA